MNTRSMTNLYKRLICCVLLLIGSLVFASEKPLGASGQISYRIDYCQSKPPLETIDLALGCNYRPSYKPLNGGFSESPRWIRVQILSNTENSNSFAIRVAPYFLKRINFYQYTKNGWQSEGAGSLLADGQLHGDIGEHVFITSPTPENQNTYYLKIQASSLTHISVTATPWPNTSAQVSQHLLGIGSQLGILVTILVFSIISLGLSPSIVMARFGISVANLILCLLAGSGILALYIFKDDPLLNELIFHWALCLRLGLWVWVSQAFLISYKTPRWYKGSCWAMYCLVGISILLMGFDREGIANLLMVIGIIMAPITQIIAIIQTPKITRPLQLALISGFCISIALIILAIVSVLFPQQGSNQAPIYLSRLSDFINPLVLLSIIVFQNRLRLKELDEVKIVLSETRLRSEFEGKLLKDRRTLIDMLAHELKNPLASIGLAVDTLSQSLTATNTNDQKRLSNISQSILNMDAIIERCSLMNLIDQKSLPLRLSEIHLYSFITSLVESLNCKQATLLQIDAWFMITTDPQFLKIILTNLIENGLKYSAVNSKIKIKAEEVIENNRSIVRILIANTIPAELAPDPTLLFQRFYRHPLAQETRGSGLGLYICKELSIILEGDIRYSCLDNEITFTLDLPK